jgi:hypothetical protein
MNNLIPQSKFEMITDTGAVAAAASPWWLPWLKTISDDAALILPILGVAWLLLQIGLKIWEVRRRA